LPACSNASVLGLSLLPVILVLVLVLVFVLVLVLVLVLLLVLIFSHSSAREDVSALRNSSIQVTLNLISSCIATRDSVFLFRLAPVSHSNC
jgi:uncharacterized protein (DUF58 family)